jgi:glucosylglycerate synthase
LEKPLHEENYLSDDFIRQLMSVGEVDLLVGVPSHNNAGTIGGVVQIVEESFLRNFPRERVVIVNVDGGSRDKTSEILLNTQTGSNGSSKGLSFLRTVHRISMRYGNAPSPGTALRTILASADLLRARACAVISPETSTLTPDWIAGILRPAYRDSFDFVAPLYERNKFDGLLARNLLYPVNRAVFGVKIRELHASEFGFSGRLATHCLNQEAWSEDAFMAAPEAWMVINAFTSGFRLCQTFLGEKLPPAAAPGKNAVAAVRQAVGTLFLCLETYANSWLNRAESETVMTTGPEHELKTDPMRFNRKKIIQMFRDGVAELGPILDSILSAPTLEEIRRISSLDDFSFRFPDELWVKTVCEFAGAYHRSVINRDHLLQALVPIYRGRIYSYLLQHDRSSADDIESATEALCLEFEKHKSYLVDCWQLQSEVKQ